MELEEFSSIVGDIYDAALDSTLWPHALRKITDFVGGYSTSIFAKDVAARSACMFFQDGVIAPEHIDLYFNYYVKLDPCTIRHYFTDVGAICTTADVMPYEEFLQTRIYQEWALPQGLFDHAAAVLDKSATGVSLFGIFRHQRQGKADEEMLRRMALLVPHVQRAVRIAGSLEWQRWQNDVLSSTLDSLNAGVILLSARGEVAHANAAGIASLDDGPLRLSGGRITGVDPALEPFLQEVMQTSCTGDQLDLRAAGVSHPALDAKGGRWVIHALPLQGERRAPVRGCNAVAILFVQRAQAPSVAMPEVIAKAFNLTPGELRVLLSVVELGGVRQVAEALGLGETTVKSHLRGVYEKTGVRRQAGLVKLVAGYGNPLA